MILHPQLEKDCFVVGQLSLCTVLLMNDSSYPWFILVPQREGITEIHQLSEEDQQQLMRESSQLAAVIEKEFNADKINIAALGNMVPQLHIHHIVRYRTDPAWPAPVWGKFPNESYASGKAKLLCERMSILLVDTD
ncbi:MAG: diadenosine tetraphosphate hydrolase [Zetaproteobacteria bacterium CG_4_9_14_3_um_filter_53_7]|nr:MAG: diadenosine tetraphosphate hydrolase [Zetaproteobacteria bacterium CG_4_9_14_3_um_filter_53_7]